MSITSLWRRWAASDAKRATNCGRRRRRPAGSHACFGVERLEDRRLLSIDPSGPEFRVNTLTINNQSASTIGASNAGGFVIAWQSNAQDGSGSGIYAQLYDAAGAQVDGEFRVNTFTPGNQSSPSAAMDAAGNFVIVWVSASQDGGGEGVYAQAYDAAGLPQGGEFRVNTFTAGNQSAPAVAMDAAGNFVIAWQSAGQDGSGTGVYARAYHAGGSPRGGEFRVNTFTADVQGFPSVAMDADGDFLVAWGSVLQDGSGFGVYAQAYNAAAAPQNGEFRANTFTSADQHLPSVAMDDNGFAVIAWQSSMQDGSSDGVFARRFGPGGVPQGPEFPVNTFTEGLQRAPSVALDANGDFVITWTSYGQDGSEAGVFAQAFSASGVPQGGELRVNTFTSSSQSAPRVALDATGDAIITWSSFGQDGSNYGVYAQRFEASNIAVIDNSDPAGFSLSGDWALGGGPGVGRNGNVQQAYGESFLTNVDMATWTFDLIGGPGRYRVSATWFTNTDPMFNPLWSTAAAYEVSDGPTALGTALINQRLTPSEHPGSFTEAGSDWADLGAFDFTGSTLTVRLRSGFDDKYVIADAIRIERIADLPAAAEVHVTMGGLYGLSIVDGTGTASFGSTDFNQPVQKTFTISNQGTAALSIPGPVTVTGSVFTVLSQPALTTLNPGQSTTFPVQMSGATTGVQTATVSFANSDGDEAPYDFTVSGTVQTIMIIDDRDSGFFMSPDTGAPGGWGINGSVGRPGADGIANCDYVYNLNNPGVDELAAWTFNITPGQYRVSTTWPFNFSAFDDAAPFTIFDGPVAGGVVRGGRNIDQKNTTPDDSFYPDGFGFPPGFGGLARWETIDLVNITGNTLTVLLQADSLIGEYVLADSVLIDRQGDIPAGPEIVVVENTRNAVAGTLDYGTTALNHSVDKTFTITNSGTSTLNITSPMTLTGANAAAFQVISGPSSTAIVPGGTSTFVVRLTAAYEGTKNATITFTTNDADEGTVNLNVTANVLPYRMIDDQDAANGYSEVNMAESQSGISYQGDVSFANSTLFTGGVISSATWTFNNMSPGIFYIALTWFDTSGSPGFYSSTTPVTVMDGGVVEGSFSVNQKAAPASFSFDGAAWLILGYFDFSEPTITVTMSNLNTDGVILADGVLMNRIGGSGNGASPEGVGSLFQAAPESRETINAASLRPEKDSRPLHAALHAAPAIARDAVFSSALGYWDEELPDPAIVLVEDSARDSDGYFAELVSAGRVDDLEEVAPELPDWLW